MVVEWTDGCLYRVVTDGVNRDGTSVGDRAEGRGAKWGGINVHVSHVSSGGGGGGLLIDGSFLECFKCTLRNVSEFSYLFLCALHFASICGVGCLKDVLF